MLLALRSRLQALDLLGAATLACRPRLLCPGLKEVIIETRVQGVSTYSRNLNWDVNAFVCVRFFIIPCVFRELGARVCVCACSENGLCWSCRAALPHPPAQLAPHRDWSCSVADPERDLWPRSEDAVPCEPPLLRGQESPEVLGWGKHRAGASQKRVESSWISKGARAAPHMPGTCLPHVGMLTKNSLPKGCLGSFRHHLGSFRCKPVSELWSSALLWPPMAASVAWLEFCLFFLMSSACLCQGM